jgi:DUF4097 and DUF4098 domain-containing protein YvlB
MRTLRTAGAGLLFALFAAVPARADETASRTDKITADLGKGSELRVENVSGDLEASPGSAFSAIVTIEAKASTSARAQQLLQKIRVLETRDGKDLTLTTRWPRELRREGVTARYALTIPRGVDVVLETVQGEVRVRGLDGEIRVQSVNGRVEVQGARRTVSASTVNGAVEVESAAVPESADLSLSTVNGNVTLTLPKDSAFDLSATTMSGSIVSTFDLPRKSAATWVSQDGSVVIHPKKMVRVDLDDEDFEPLVEIEEFERDLAGAEEEVGKEAVREMRRIAILDPRLGYRGRIGRGGANVSLSAVNGRLAVLTAGIPAAQARELVSGHRSVVITIPQVPVQVPRVRVPKPVVELLPTPRVVGVAPPMAEGAGITGIVRGDIQGDFLSTSGGGNYRLGDVSGKVQIRTQWGEIRVGSSGGPADLKTHGGDVVIGAVGGSFLARTMAGSIEAGPIGGSATADTSGGDIRLTKVGGSLKARTDGGDIVVDEVWGSVEAETGGGDVRVRCTGRPGRGSVTIRNSGGDVELTLPSDFKASVELLVLGSPDPDERRIRSDFPGLAVTRHGTSQRAVGEINGGGNKVTIQTSSGSIRLKKE